MNVWWLKRNKDWRNNLCMHYNSKSTETNWNLSFSSFFPYSKVSNKRGTTAIYFWKKSTHCVLIRYVYFTKFKKIPSKCSDFLSGNTNSFEISVYLLHFTLLRLFIAWDLSSTTLIRCTTVIRYFRVVKLHQFCLTECALSEKGMHTKRGMVSVCWCALSESALSEVRTKRGIAVLDHTNINAS